MRLRSALLLGVAFTFPPLQRRVAAQRSTGGEVGMGAAVAVARKTFAGGEASVGIRPGPQTRAMLAIAGGSDGGHAAARAQLSVQFLVMSSQRRGVGVYAGVGTVLALARGSAGAGFVAILLGLEGAPRHSGGWYVEAGLGDGARAAAGWRLRWFRR